MFVESLVGSGGGARTPTKYTVGASLLLQSLLVAVAALAPLIITSPLPARQLWTRFVGPPAARAAGKAPPSQRIAAARPRLDTTVLVQPDRIPTRVVPLDDQPAAGAIPDLAAVLPGVPGGLPHGVGAGGIGLPLPGLETAAPPSVPNVETPSRKPPVPVGGDVQKAKLIHGPRPVYPLLARQARVSGLVRLEAVIAKDGVVQQLRVLSGHPLLVPAARDAISKWRYRPTLLNGEPVEVITLIDVSFTLTP